MPMDVVLAKNSIMVELQYKSNRSLTQESETEKITVANKGGISRRHLCLQDSTTVSGIDARQFSTLCAESREISIAVDVENLSSRCDGLA